MQSIFFRLNTVFRRNPPLFFPVPDAFCSYPPLGTIFCAEQVKLLLLSSPSIPDSMEFGLTMHVPIADFYKAIVEKLITNFGSPFYDPCNLTSREVKGA